jgi:SecD/SecF fusion protein
MQSKGAIRLLAILLAVVCLYQISFTIVTRTVENKARKISAGDERLYTRYIDSIQDVGVYNLLLKNYTYKECKEREINLGLDLKGGMNVTLEVSIPELIDAMAGANRTDPVFQKAMAEALRMQQNSQEDFVTLFGRAFTRVDPNARLAAIFGTAEFQGRIGFNSTNEEVLQFIKQECDDAVSRTFNILRTRIDKFGVTQPSIRQLARGRIMVELPGVKEPERVRKLLQGTARLEFWETYENSEVFESLQKVNDLLRDKPHLLNGETPVAGKDTVPSAGEQELALTNPSDTVNQVGTDTAMQAQTLLSEIEGDTARKDTARADTFEDFVRENPFFALLSPAIFQNANNQSEFQKGPVIGYALIRDTSKVNRILALPEVRALLPRDLKVAWGVKPPMEGSSALELVALKVTTRDGRPPLDGTVITDARQDFGQFNNKPEVAMSMNAEGARIWKRLTGENVGRSVAIVLDDYVYSYPTVQSEIAGGRSTITGQFTISEAKDLANILKAGKLPAPARIVEEAVVGPSLGKEAIQSGLISFVIALILVLAFMVAYYNNAGWAADLALFANVYYIIGVLASLGAVLTLPGIAGIVLTVGMAVDANILIYERIREEIKQGKGIRLAISDGFKRAYSAIIDANVTTLLTGIILFVFGSGPIQGFATTLIIGILTSLFSAIFITRLRFEWNLARNKPIRFSFPWNENFLKNTQIDFVGKRKIFYVLSGIIILAGIISIIVRGFSLGVDFKGGRSYVIRFDEPVRTVDIRARLTEPLGGAPEVKTFGPANQVRVTTAYLIHDNSAEADDKAEAVITAALGIDNSQIMSSQKVGPSIAEDIKREAVLAVTFSLIVIFLYILLRFRQWSYSAGAIIALAHDTLFILSLFSFFWGVLPFSLDIDQAFIAAILTVMGYSMNDTVVVFDRLREYISEHPKMEKMTLINRALNATLSRTLNTSLTILFVLVAIFIFGGEVIRGFAFALLVGIIVGTYSSVCIATPIVVDLSGRRKTLKKT